MTANALANFGVMELKGDDADPAEIVLKGLDDFKASVDDRLKAIEAKANDNVVTGRLDKIEAALKRPNLILKGDDAPAETKAATEAYGKFLKTGGLAGLNEIERKALTVADNGEVLAPEERTTEFIRNLVQFSPIRAYADVRTARSHTVVIPKRTGITNAAWKGEVVATTASAPSFDEKDVKVFELGTHVDMSKWLEEDSIFDVEAEVRLALAEDFGKKEATAFVNGNGTTQPTGFMTAAGIAETINGHATNLSADALIGLLYAQPQVYRLSGVWVMNGATLATIRKLKDGQGNYLWQPSYQAGQPETILGRPVIEAIDMPDIASGAFPVAFGDFKSGYRIYDRVELAVLVNPYAVATEGLTRYHARRRVGADVVRPDAFRKLKMSAT